MDPGWFEWPPDQPYPDRMADDEADAVPAERTDRVAYVDLSYQLEVRPAFQWSNLRVTLMAIAAGSVIPLMVVAALLVRR